MCTVFVCRPGPSWPPCHIHSAHFNAASRKSRLFVFRGQKPGNPPKERLQRTVVWLDQRSPSLRLGLANLQGRAIDRQHGQALNFFRICRLGRQRFQQLDIALLRAGKCSHTGSGFPTPTSPGVFFQTPKASVSKSRIEGKMRALSD